MKLGFLSTRRDITIRVFDSALTLTLVGFLMSFYGWALVQIRLVGLMGLFWAGTSYGMQRVYGHGGFKWWVHVLGAVLFLVMFAILSVIFQDGVFN